MGQPENENSVLLMQPAVEAMQLGGLHFQIMGSLGLLGFNDPASRIVDKDIWAPPDLYKPNFRRPGDKADIDIRLETTDPLLTARVEEIAKAKIPKDETGALKLEPEVFGLIPGMVLIDQYVNPLSWLNMKIGVADRYQLGETVYRAAFPFAVRLPEEARETWYTHVGDIFTYPVPHPGTSIGNYVGRSIAGLRLRNRATVNRATERLLREVPGAYEWMMDKDGPGRAQLRLAEIFLGLRGIGASNPVIIGDTHSRNHLVLNPVNPKEIRELPEFLLRDAESDLQTAVLALVRAKIIGIRPVEQNKALDAIWSRYLMPHAGSFIHPERKGSTHKEASTVNDRLALIKKFGTQLLKRHNRVVGEEGLEPSRA